MTSETLWALLKVDCCMLAALLACCLVASHGLTRRSRYPLRLAVNADLKL